MHPGVNPTPRTQFSHSRRLVLTILRPNIRNHNFRRRPIQSMRNDLTKTMDTTIWSETYQKGVFFINLCLGSPRRESRSEINCSIRSRSHTWSLGEPSNNPPKLQTSHKGNGLPSPYPLPAGSSRKLLRTPRILSAPLTPQKVS